jgi:hypothetical protein
MYLYGLQIIKGYCIYIYIYIVQRLGTTNNQLESMWKEVGRALAEALSHRLPAVVA